MYDERLTPDDDEPIRIRTTQIFAGNGETTFVQTAYCPTCERSVPIDRRPGDSSISWDHEHAPEVTLRHVSERGMQPGRTPIAEVMTTHVLCVRPDVSLEALRSLLIERKISGVPVVDADGAPVGIISKTDLVRQRYEDGDTTEVDTGLERGLHGSTLAHATVAELMTPVPVTFSEHKPVSQVATAMAAQGLHRLPIVGEGGAVVGIVSSLDLVGWYARQDEHQQRARRTTASRSTASRGG